MMEEAKARDRQTTLLARLWYAVFGKAEQPRTRELTLEDVSTQRKLTRFDMPAYQFNPPERWLTVRDFLIEQRLDLGISRGMGRTASMLMRKHSIEPRMAFQKYPHQGKRTQTPVRSYPESVLVEALDHQTKPKEVK